MARRPLKPKPEDLGAGLFGESLPSQTHPGPDMSVRKGLIDSMLKPTWRLPDMASLPDWGSARRVGIDVETRDDHLKDLGIGVRRGGYVVGFSVTIEDGPSVYLPIRHQLGTNLPEQEVLRYMRDNARRFNGAYVGANLSYDLDYLWQEGIVSNGPNVRYLDVQVADPLIWELHRSYSLKSIAERHGLPGKDEAELERAAKMFGVHPKSGIWRMPPEYVGAYAEQDTKLPLQIMRRLERQIDEQDLQQVWEIESQVLPVLVKLRRRGVRIDIERLARIREWSRLEEAKEVAEIKRLTGIDIGMERAHRADAVLPVLEQAGISTKRIVWERHDDGTESRVEKDALDALLLKTSTHPAMKCILRARKLGKLRNTFAASVERYMVNGRLHCTFNQVVRQAEDGSDDTEGARPGRLSCKDPNLQQQPARDEFASEWRSIYIPEEGAEWGCLDYSQQEPRWTTHWATVLQLEKAEEAAEEYRTNPKADNHDMMAKLTGLPRKSAKTIYLGLCYGQGGARLCGDLGLPSEYAVGYLDKSGQYRMEYLPDRRAGEARRSELASEGIYNARGWPCAGPEGRSILEQFDNKAPFIKKLSKIAQKRAEKNGFIKSASGRRLHFEVKGDGYDKAHKALNRLIQGSAADQTKRAMVIIDREMPDTFVQLQVHDEMDGSFGDRQEMRRMAKIMREAWPDTKVPFRVDVEAGPSWGQIKDIE